MRFQWSPDDRGERPDSTTKDAKGLCDRARGEPVSARGYYRSSGSTTAEVLPARDNRRGMAVACPTDRARLAGRRMTKMKLWMMMFVMVMLTACVLGREDSPTPTCTPGGCYFEWEQCRLQGGTPLGAECRVTGTTARWICGECIGGDAGARTDTGTSRRGHYEVCSTTAECPPGDECTNAFTTHGMACRPLCNDVEGMRCPPEPMVPNTTPSCSRPTMGGWCFIQCLTTDPQCPYGQRCAPTGNGRLGICSTVGMPANPRTYDPCTRDSNCLTGQTCTEVAPGWGFACRPACTMDRNCPQADTGTAIPICARDLQRCYISCTRTNTCPAGQTCVFVNSQDGYCRAQ